MGVFAATTVVGLGAILSDAPHLVQRTSLFTIAGDASASDNRASPFSAGVGAIAATASTAAAKRNIRPPEAEKRGGHEGGTSSGPSPASLKLDQV